MARKFVACKKKVSNRGAAPDSFLNEMIDWAREASHEIFERNDNHDVYSNVVVELGPYVDLRHRKAVMLEVLCVLGGFESSWNFSRRELTRQTRAPIARVPKKRESFNAPGIRRDSTQA